MGNQVETKFQWTPDICGNEKQSKFVLIVFKLFTLEIKMNLDLR